MQYAHARDFLGYISNGCNQDAKYGNWTQHFGQPVHSIYTTYTIYLITQNEVLYPFYTIQYFYGDILLNSFFCDRIKSLFVLIIDSVADSDTNLANPDPSVCFHPGVLRERLTHYMTILCFLNTNWKWYKTICQYTQGKFFGLLCCLSSLELWIVFLALAKIANYYYCLDSFFELFYLRCC